ncbi:MAG: RusA family crossover junction endodeoxyribonuclease [Phascolarctobacterium sp.]|nr:RusA family crossover junction endodeoxyribonuclease [Phascolarctobacterium sp.]MUU07915.1 RusA family crossover junction endodeoxyribonuclease [Phascolarctobacterium sp.]MUU17559.1 RusA family crossover junction endodeoxyribonuclease [Phascolarctobacterium sp.]
MSEILITIPGEPCAQGRPRISTAGGFPRAYDPAKSRNYKAFVKLIAQEEIPVQGWRYTELPLAVTITAYMSIPSSKSKKFKQAAALGVERPTKKPDIDNIFKCVTDALSGIAYKDDKQIVAATVNKRYAEVPRVEVLIRII